jgi:hypothetical protein
MENTDHRAKQIKGFKVPSHIAALFRMLHQLIEEGVRLKDIAAAIGRGLNVPVTSISQEKAQERFGFFGFFAGRDSPVSSSRTREQLGWNPTGPDLLTDRKSMRY